MRRTFLLGAATALFLGASLTATAGAEHTPSAPMLTLTGPGTLTPIIDSGQTHDGFLFEGLPDGIGVMPGHGGTVEVFVNHEQSTVPFQNTADFQDSSVDQLTVDTDSVELVEGSVAIPADAGFLRFCSAFMAGPDVGFDRYTFLTGEETNDVVDVPPGAPYGSDPAVAPQRQGGYAVALDARSGRYTPLGGLGRMNHENVVVVPGGWRQRIAALTTDDTFSPPTSQLYEYLASSPRQFTQDRGGLWAFRVTRTDEGAVDPTDPFNGANDYLDIQPGDDWRGEFIRVPRRIAAGQTSERPQEALERWSNAHNAFQFIRLEDLATDDHDPRVVYVADTGSTRVVHDDATGRMVRGPSGTVGHADNGRIFRFELNAHNPRKVDSFSVFADGDAPGSPVFAGFTSPDNLDTSEHSLMVQEDTASAAIWRYDFGAGTWSTVATVNDPVGESSGIVDASEWFGDGAWLVTVQAHGTFVDQEQQGTVLVKREAGQLLLMTIPGT